MTLHVGKTPYAQEEISDAVRHLTTEVEVLHKMIEHDIDHGQGIDPSLFDWINRSLEKIKDKTYEY